jgi:CO/xanthine dehydrogenase Mo-binding subunit
MTEQLVQPRAMGRDLVRRDGPAKVRGTATYAYETPVEHPAFCHPVQVTIARGRVASIDTSDAEALDGVLAVLTPDNAERLASTDDAELAILQSDEVAFRGQFVGVVIAETSEIARQAADLVRVTYEEQAHDVELSADRDDLYTPDQVNPTYPADTADGDVAAAMAAAPWTVEATVLIGDTDYPIASVAGGSSGTATWGSAIVEAAREFRRKFGDGPEDGDEAQGSVGPANEDYTMSAYGAQFAEAHVNVDTGEIRVPRLYGVFAAGRIINPRTARSQSSAG